MIFLYDITNQPMDRGAFLLYEIGQYSAVREWRNVINHAPTRRLPHLFFLPGKASDICRTAFLGKKTIFPWSFQRKRLTSQSNIIYLLT